MSADAKALISAQLDAKLRELIVAHRLRRLRGSRRPGGTDETGAGR